MDDVGASSKEFAIYSKKWFGLANILFLKRLKYFKAWGPYREITSVEWEKILVLLKKHSAKLTVGVTASWVTYEGDLIPFPEKCPSQAQVLKNGVQDGLIEIANHGLTHCVLQQHLFRPKFFSSNRTYHREFWDWLGENLHFYHIEYSQKILQEYFECDITTLIPPGNVFSSKTISAAKKNGIKRINCQTTSRVEDTVNIIGNENIIDFHDKEIVEVGVSWLERIIESNLNNKFLFVREL